jgi:beta-barrel assembly-enhancing protease
VTILDRVGYDSAALVDMLEVMDARLGPVDGLCRPTPRRKAASGYPRLAPKTRSAAVAIRQQRFKQALQQV